MMQMAHLERIVTNLSSCKLRALAGHEGGVNVLEWAPEGDLLASASADHTVKLWHVEQTGQTREVLELKDHTKPVEQVKWIDRNRLVTASEDKTVKVWDVRQGKCIESFTTGGSNINLACNPNGEQLVVGDSKDVISLIDLRKKEVVLSANLGSELGCQLNELSWDPTGTFCFFSTAYASTQSRGGVQIVNTRNGKFEKVHTFMAHCGNCFTLTFAPLPKRNFAVGGMDGLVTLWDTVNLACVRSFSRSDTMIRAIGFNWNGDMIAYGSQDKVIYIDDVVTGKPLGTLDASMVNGVCAIAWHTGKNILAFSGDEPKGTKMGFVRVAGENFT